MKVRSLKSTDNFIFLQITNGTYDMLTIILFIKKQQFHASNNERKRDF